MDYRNVLTVCPYCGAGCNLYLQVLDGRVIGVLPAKQHVISEGALCIKGWNAAAFVHHEDRITQPMARRNGDFEPIGWDEALDMVADRLAGIRRAHGPDAVGFLASAKCTNEENYLFQKLARGVIGTNNVDHCARL
jgi:predicted molibdopterin-dependent oxidoreductase YjgC